MQGGNKPFKREAFTLGDRKPSIDGGPHKNAKPSRHEQTKIFKNTSG